MIIDAHIHAGVSEDLAHSWDTFEDIEVSLRRMDEAGIDKAVVLPIGIKNYEMHNRETADIVARYPDRLFGFAKVSQKQDEGRVAKLLEEAFEKLGLYGLKLHGHPNREIMEVLNKYRKPLLADVYGEVYPLRYVAESYPQIPIIIAHMGQFLTTNPKPKLETLWLAKRYENVYFDTSSVSVHEWLERAIKEGLAHKMIFGSDGPVCHCGVELARIEYLNLTDEQKELVLYKNIARLLGEDA